MALPNNYNPDSYKSEDLFERLGLKRSQEITPSIVDGNWRVISDYWTQMRSVPNMLDQVAPAHNAIAAARDTLRDPIRLREYLNKVAPNASKSNVLLIGGTGAGKSALIGAIYDSCNRAGAMDPFRVRMGDAKGNVGLNLQALKQFCMASAPRNDVIPRRANASGETVQYDLVLSLLNLDRLQIRFIDTAGEDLYKVLDADDGRQAYLSEQIQECQAAILVVDTPALKLQPDLLDAGLEPRRMRNLPENVRHIVDEWLQLNPAAPRIFCIVPIKTEGNTYNDNGRRDPLAAQDIINQTLSLYRDTIDSLENNGHCAIVVTPVETCGCLRLRADVHLIPEEGGNYPDYHWERIRENGRPKQYTPADCQVPLVFLLNFFLKLVDNHAGASPQQIIDTIKVPTRWIDTLSGFFGKGLVDRMVNEFNGVIGKLGPLLNVVSKLIGLQEPDTKVAIQQLIGRNLRWNSLWVGGNTSVLDLDQR